MAHEADCSVTGVNPVATNCSRVGILSMCRVGSLVGSLRELGTASLWAVRNAFNWIELKCAQYFSLLCKQNVRP